MKKALAVLLSVLMLAGMIFPTVSFGAGAVSESEYADDNFEDDVGDGNTYSVIGSSKKIFWDAYDVEDTTTEMTYDPRVMLYKLMFYDVEPENNIFIQVIKNHNADEILIGHNYITFDVVSKCDILVTYDVKTGDIDVFGEGIREKLDAQTVTVENNFIGGSQSGSVNMTQTSSGVWEYTAEDVSARNDCKIKFTASLTSMEQVLKYFFGAEEEKVYPSGAVLDVVCSGFNSKNFIFSVPEDGASVHFKLDLNGFNCKYKSRELKGAKLTITVDYTEPTYEPPIETTVEPTKEPTEEPTEEDRKSVV